MEHAIACGQCGVQVVVQDKRGPASKVDGPSKLIGGGEAS